MKLFNTEVRQKAPLLCCLLLLVLAGTSLAADDDQEKVPDTKHEVSAFVPVTSRLKRPTLVFATDENGGNEAVSGSNKTGSAREARTLSTLKSLIALLPTRNPVVNSPKADTDGTKNGGTGSSTTAGNGIFSLANLLPGGLRALEGLDDVLRSTVPRVDRFNCLERVMCEIAAPFQEDDSGIGNSIDDGVQTLQQINGAQLLPQFLQQSLQSRPASHHQQQQHFLQPHQQQFLQHQQHQKRFINRQVAAHHQQPQPAGPAAPPLPYYIPTDPAGVVPRGPNAEQQVNPYLNNDVRRDEQFRGSELQQHVNRPHGVQNNQNNRYRQHRQTQQVYQLPAQSNYGNINPYEVNSPHQPTYNQYQYQVPYEYQESSNKEQRYVVPPGVPQKRTQSQRRRQPSFRNFINNVFNLGGNTRRSPARRNRRDVDTDSVEKPKRSSRRSKVAPEFQPTQEAIPKSEAPESPIKTLSKEDLEGIRARIRSLNEKYATNGTKSSGRSHSSRQGRFLETLLNGWSANSLLGLLDKVMEGYSFHPYSHAAYMGYTSRAGTCAQMYPRCPDDANDWLDFVNNFHQYFPDGLPFADRLPWPFSLVV